MLNRITDSLEFHGQALALRSERQRLIASNIANADTPGYVARDVNFGALLREATSGAAGRGPGALAAPAQPLRAPSTLALGGASGALLQASMDTTVGANGMAMTNALHLGGSTVDMAGGIPAEKLLYSTASQTNLDGNSVDMDQQRANFADNAIKYEATLRFINGNVRTMLDAIKGQS